MPESASTAPTVDVVIVNWNTSTAALTAAAAYVASEGVHPRITIVDNHSSEQQLRTLSQAVPEGVQLVLRQRNLGYGAAANAVLADSTADYVCVSNPDLVPSREMLAALAAELRADDRIGLAAPALGSAYHVRLPRPGALLLKPFAGGIGVRVEPSPLPGEVRNVEQPAGACLMARSAVWRELGGFDTGFFMWYEDVDLARRCLQTGRRNVVVGNARAQHQGAAAFMQLDARARQHLRLESLERYGRKHHPRIGLALRVSVGAARRLRAGRRGSRAAERLRT